MGGVERPGQNPALLRRSGGQHRVQVMMCAHLLPCTQPPAPACHLVPHRPSALCSSSPRTSRSSRCAAAHRVWRAGKEQGCVGGGGSKLSQAVPRWPSTLQVQRACQWQSSVGAWARAATNAGRGRCCWAAGVAVSMMRPAPRASLAPRPHRRPPPAGRAQRRGRDPGRTAGHDGRTQAWPAWGWGGGRVG